MDGLGCSSKLQCAWSSSEVLNLEEGSVSPDLWRQPWIPVPCSVTCHASSPAL